MKEFLLNLLGFKPLETILLYSGSLDDSWNYIDFHTRCDDKGPTITLFQIKNGDCIGGYTEATWETKCGYKKDDSAFLFNLTRSLKFASKGSGKEIFCGSAYGPCFSGSDIYLIQPFNGENNCFSYVDREGYKIELEGGKNQLTNKENGPFTITELEVWLVLKSD